MYIDNFKHDDNWQDIKDSAMNTVGKTTGKYPDSEWKRKLILSEHSPIRRMKFYWRWYGIKLALSTGFRLRGVTEPELAVTNFRRARLSAMHVRRTRRR